MPIPRKHVTQGMPEWLDTSSAELLREPTSELFTAMNDVLEIRLPELLTDRVQLTKIGMGLGNVDNTRDMEKPVSHATGTLVADLADATLQALSARAPLESPTFTGTVRGVSKAMVGLGSVDNTADANKPVSTPQKAYTDAVGTRVSALEGAVGGTRKARLVSQLSVWNTELFIVEIPSYTFKAGRSYLIKFFGKHHSDAVNQAATGKVRVGLVGTTGVNTAHTMLFDKTLWTAPTAMSGHSTHFEEYFDPAEDATLRVYGTLVRAVGTGTIFATPGWTIAVEDKGLA